MHLVMPPGGVSAICAALTALLLTGACGYRMDTVGLPDNAKSLGIGQIRNYTYTGELDVRLKHELRRKLLRNPAFTLTSPEHSELVLEVSLTRLTVSRPLDVSDTDLSALLYRLRGSVSVFRTFPERRLVLKQRITTIVRLDFDRPVMETPAVRDEINEDVVIAFAAEIEQALFRHF
jgi:hypothetical protein